MNTSNTPKKPAPVQPATTQQETVNQDEIPTVILTWHPTLTATK